jgi:hypothetical protein
VKKTAIAIILIIGIQAWLSAPANAIFGQSKCEKAKSQVMKNYVREIQLLSDYKKAFGYSSPEIGIKASTPSSTAVKMRVLKKTADFEFKNFNFVMTNYFCFTKSQHQYAIKMYDYWYMIKSYTDRGLNYVSVLERTTNVPTYSVLDY